jgi:hypothetical protein
MARALASLSAVLRMLLLAAGPAACSKDDPAPAPAPSGDYKTSTKNDLQWKRYAALEADLVRGLELDAEAVCTELGRASCINGVHLVPLGGNDPIETNMLQPSGEPLATTPSVVDRVLLSACGSRVALDAGGGQLSAVVFRELDLAGPAPARTDRAVSATVVELYRRLLARDPNAREVELVSALAEDGEGKPVRAAEFATVACFAIGSTTEFLFF